MKKICLCLLVVMAVLLSACNSQTGKNSSRNFESSSMISPSVSSQNVSTTPTSSSFINSCNNFAGGYLHYVNGKYFYSNLVDGNKLYMCDAGGENQVCVDTTQNEVLPHIKSIGNNLYYLVGQRLEQPQVVKEYEVPFNMQLYCLVEGKKTLLSAENVISYDVCDEYIFYSAADLKVYRMKPDGSDKKAIFDINHPMELQVSGGKIFLHSEETVIELDYNGKEKSAINIPNYHFVINGDKVYYIDLNSFKLMYKNNDSAQAVIADEVISFNIYNDKIVYQLLNEEKIYISDLDGQNKKYLCDGKNPLVANGFLVCIKGNKITKVS